MGTKFGLKRAPEMNSASDPVEVVWGIGVASWRIQGKTIEYPILLQGVELTIDDQTRSILVSARESEPMVELANFSKLGNEDTSQALKSVMFFFEQLDRKFSPFDESSFFEALNACVSALDFTGFMFDKNQTDPPELKPPGASERLG